MSKSKGNVIDPWEIFRTKGADPLRWYFFSAGSPWTNRRVYGEGIDESIRKFLLTLWNTLSFFVTYANLEGWTPGDAAEPEHVLDRWIASRREATVAGVTDALEGYDTLAAAQALESFVDDLSNWYVRRSRPRFWKASDPGAFAALYRSLTTVAKLLAPFCPFVADEIHAVLGMPEVSVHLEDWPEADRRLLDADLESEMALARRLVALGRAARGEARLKVRQPLRRALLLVPGARRLSPDVAAQVSEELNVKALEVVENLAGLIRYSVVPNFRALGPRLGPRLPAVKAALASADGAEVSRSLDETGSYTVTIDGEPIPLGADDLEVRAEEHEEFALAQDGPFAVALDLKVDEELRSEGLARELSRAINDHRRASGLAIADRIKVRLWASGLVAEAAARHGSWIAGEVLAVSWQVNPAEPAEGAALDVEGCQVTLALEVAG
jgi:isoleucyl-tRNA synthetase